MPKAREALAQSDIDEAVAAERDRCAWLCDELAGRWERSAADLRIVGTHTTRAIWPPFKKTTFIAPGHRKAAESIEAAVHGLRTVARGIREGWDHEDRPRMAGEIAAGREVAQHDEAKHGVRLHPLESYSVSGAARTVWPAT